MKRFLLRLWCWLFGHQYTDIAFQHGYWDCERCSLSLSTTECPHCHHGEPFTVAAFLGRRWRWVRDIPGKVRWWLDKQKQARFFRRHRADHLDYHDDIPF